MAAGHSQTAETILCAWFADKAEHTVRNYRHDLEDFAVYLSRALGISPLWSVSEALTHLFRQASPAAQEVGLGFRSHLRSASLSPASINRHLATLRSVTKRGRLLGMTTWYLEVPNLKAETRRATRGPTADEIRRMLATTSGDTEAETRDAAILVTFYCLGLRVSELCGLRLEDTDLSRGSTLIKGKGRREREPVPLPAPVVEAIRRYLKHRGPQAGPLFQSRHPWRRSERSDRDAQRAPHRARTRTARWPARLVSEPPAQLHYTGGGTRSAGGPWARQDSHPLSASLNVNVDGLR